MPAAPKQPGCVTWPMTISAAGRNPAVQNGSRSKHLQGASPGRRVPTEMQRRMQPSRHQCYRRQCRDLAQPKHQGLPQKEPRKLRHSQIPSEHFSKTVTAQPRRPGPWKDPSVKSCNSETGQQPAGCLSARARAAGPRTDGGASGFHRGAQSETTG